MSIYYTYTYMRVHTVNFHTMYVHVLLHVNTMFNTCILYVASIVIMKLGLVQLL